MFIMEIIDNVRYLLKDDLLKEIQPHAKLSIAVALFSMYEFNELKKQLEGIDSLRFIRAEGLIPRSLGCMKGIKSRLRYL
jgi:hypothetical protein